MGSGVTAIPGEKAVALAAGGKAGLGWVLPLMVIVIGAFMSILDASIVNVALPAIMNNFNVTTTDIQWVATIYMLALGVIVPASGWLGDHFGYKKLYLISLIIFTFGSFLCGFSWSLPALIAARVVQAIGGGIIMPTTMAMVYRMVPRDKIGTAMGIWGLALVMAPAVGPTLGGYLVEFVNWRLIFSINIPIGILGVGLAYLILKEFPRVPAGYFDLWGFVTSAVGLFALLLALSEGGKYGWRSEFIVYLLYISAAALGLFVYIELNQANPLLDLRLFRYSAFAFSNLMSAIITISMFAGIFYIPLFLQTVRGLGALETGMLMMPAALASGVVMPIGGRLYDYFGPRLIAVIGILLMAYTTFLFSKISVVTPNDTIMGWLVLRGIGIGLVMMPSQTAGISAVPTRLVGRASAISNVIQRVSGSFGIAVLTSLLSTRMAFHTEVFREMLSTTSGPALHYMTGTQLMLAASGQALGSGKEISLAVLQGLVSREAYVFSLNEVFWVMALFSLLGIFPALMLKKVKGQGKGDKRAGLQTGE
jgi:EmrB/QacA subfamily drug resistance transporter